MKSKTTKTLATILAVATTFSFALTGCGGGGESESKKQAAFINTIGGVSETYTGAVSQESYNTAVKAAEAFVEEEVVGDVDCEITNVASKGALSETEVTKLNLPSEISNGMLGVEKLEVEYVKEDASYYYTADTLNKTETVTVYVIKYESNFKYYSPCPITGNTITKSYYDSVFNVENYENCTYKTTMEMDMNISASYQGETEKMYLTMTMEQLVKYSENKIYLETSMTMSGNYAGVVESETEKMAAYLEMDATGISCYVKQGDSTEWVKGSLQMVGFEDLEELTPFYDQYLDYSYFTKTDYGFELSDENAEQFIDEVFSDVLGEMDFDEMLNQFNIEMFAKYYVSEGVLSGVRVDLGMDLNMKEEGVKVKMNADIVTQTTCTDYGTTVVTKPFTE